MNAEMNKLARDRAVDKVRKLLAMARDGRGNEHEAARAAEQAEKMMRAYQIETADVVMEEIEQDEAFDRGLEDVSFEGKEGHRPRQAASWVGVIAIGVGAAFTCKVDLVGSPQGVKVRFSGYAPDVAVARWVYRFLCETVYRLSRERMAGQGMAAAKGFRSGAAGVLQARLYAMKAERDKDNRAEGAAGTALVLYGRKEQRVEEMYGEQRTRKTTASISDPRAFEAGRRAGAEIGIPSGRVVQDGRVKAAGALR